MGFIFCAAVVKIKMAMIGLGFESQTGNFVTMQLRVGVNCNPNRGLFDTTLRTCEITVRFLMRQFVSPFYKVRVMFRAT